MDYDSIHFDATVKRTEGFDDRYSFSPELLGSGGFADVYTAQQGDIPLALKRFRFDEPGKVKDLSKILDNLRRLGKAIDVPDFVKIYDVGNSSYLMDRLEGACVEDLIDANCFDNGEFREVALFYSQAIEYLHSRGLMLGDVNWGSVMVTEDSFRISDLDFIASKEDYCDPDRFGVIACTPRYASREFFVPEFLVPQGDLEGFALMLDDFYYGAPLYPGEGEDRSAYIELVRMGLRHYPDERVDCLPSPLRDLVKKVLDCDRDDFVTVQDFVKALEKV
jgi:serine/threonine protein kinase